MAVGAVCMPVCVRKAQAQAIHPAERTCWYPANISSAAIMSLPSSTTVLCFTPSRCRWGVSGCSSPEVARLSERDSLQCRTNHWIA